MRLNKLFLSISILFILLYSNNLYSQYYVSGTINSYPNNNLKLYRIYGEKRFLIGTDTSDSKGNFQIQLPAGLSTGMLLLMNDERKSLKLIFNQESLHIEAIDFEQNESIIFQASPENQIWHDYTNLKAEVQHKTNLIFPILTDYPRNTSFYSASKKEYDRNEKKLQNFIQKTQRKYSDAFVTKLIKTDASPFLPERYPYSEKSDYFKNHFLDSIDFQDTTLLNSDILTKKMIDFIALFQDESLNMNDLEQEFVKAIDIILEKSAQNETMYVFTLEFFLEGFTEMGLNLVTDYLSKLPHLPNDCLSTTSLQRIDQIVSPFKKVMNGNPAPKIFGKLINGQDFDLDSIQDSRIIIVFWSAYCPHCIDLLPKLNQIKSQYPDFQIVSVITDKKLEAANDFIKQEKLGFYHLFDGLAWESPLTQTYKVYSTPTMFLIDKEHRIIGKPAGLNELIIMLND